MRRHAIIDSDDDDEYTPSTNASAGSGEQSTRSSNTPDSGFTSPVSHEDDEGPRLRKKPKSSTNLPQSQSRSPSGYLTGTGSYVDIDVVGFSTIPKNRRHTSPYVEVVSSQTSPFKPSSQTSIKYQKRDSSPPRKIAKLADKGRQAKLSMFFAKPAAKKPTKE